MATWRMCHKRRIFYIRLNSDCRPQLCVFDPFRWPKCVWHRLNYEHQPINLYALLDRKSMAEGKLVDFATRGGFLKYAKIATISRNTSFLRRLGVQSLRATA